MSFSTNVLPFQPSIFLQSFLLLVFLIYRIRNEDPRVLGYTGAEITITEDQPTSRYGHSAVVYGTSMWMFGGLQSTTSTWYNDLWEFSFLSRSWSEKSPSGSIPSTRSSHTAVVYSEKMYMYGGYGGSGLYEYDFGGDEWTALSPEGDVPINRYKHVSVVYGTFMYVFGGRKNGENPQTNELWKYSFISGTWTQITDAGSIPGRRKPTMSVYGSSMYMFYGYSWDFCSGFCSKLWRLDLTSEEWTEITVTGDYPSPMEGHASLVFGNTIHVFGGYFLNNELWRYEFDIGEWRELTISGSVPGVRESHTMVFFNNSLFIFGGCIHTNGETTNDIWEISIQVNETIGNTTSFECFGIASGDDSVCGGNGTCVSSQTCECSNYVGSQCQNWMCGEILDNETSVCSSNGSCISPQNCYCPEYVGDECQHWLCGGVVNNDSSVCSGNGTCSSPSNCDCPNFEGELCQNWVCGTILNNDSSVCSSNGSCVAPSVCSCPDYVGEECQNWLCGEKLNNDSSTCSQNGTCLSPQTCFCPDYVGNECQNWLCGDIYNNVSAVCSHNGSCISPQLCKCPDYVGNYCQNWMCGNFVNNDSSVCSGNGSCVSPQNCVCPDYYGTECQNWLCDTIFNNETSVCSSNGSCISPEDCFCPEYVGNFCQNWICGGILNNDSSVCSSNGSCVSPESCFCPNYYGDHCANWMCGNFLNNDTNVCSSNGSCINPQVCFCPNYVGADCEAWKCHGLLNNDTEACGNGTCVSPLTCVCFPDYFGDSCNVWYCGGFVYNDTSNVCSGNGSCGAPQQCFCFPGYNGSTCNELNSTGVVNYDDSSENMTNSSFLNDTIAADTLEETLSDTNSEKEETSEETSEETFADTLDDTDIHHDNNETIDSDTITFENDTISDNETVTIFETMEETNEDTSGETNEDTSEETNEDTSEETNEDTSEETNEDTSEETKTEDTLADSFADTTVHSDNSPNDTVFNETKEELTGDTIAETTAREKVSEDTSSLDEETEEPGSWKCFGEFYYSLDVCSGRGKCESSNLCVSCVKSFGDECENDIPDAVSGMNFSQVEGCEVIFDEDDQTEKLLFSCPVKRELVTDVIEKGDHEFKCDLQFVLEEEAYDFSDVQIWLVELINGRRVESQELLQSYGFDDVKGEKLDISVNYHSDYSHRIKMSQPVTSNRTIPFMLSGIEIQSSPKNPYLDLLLRLMNSLWVKIGGPVGVVTVISGAFLISIIILVIVLRKYIIKKKYIARPIEVDFSTVEPGKSKKFEEVLIESSHSLHKLIATGKSQEVIEICGDAQRSMQIIQGVISQPYILVNNLYNCLMLEDEFLNLSCDAKKEFLQFFGVSIEALVVNCPDYRKTTDSKVFEILKNSKEPQVFFQNSTFGKNKRNSSRNLKNFELCYSIDFVVQGLKVIQKHEPVISKVLQCVKNIKNTAFLLNRLVEEVGTIAKLWLAKQIAFRCVAYSLFNKKPDEKDCEPVECLLEMISCKTNRSLCLGMIYILRGLLLADGLPIELKNKIWFGSRKREDHQSLRSFLSYASGGRKDRFCIRSEMVRVVKKIRDFGISDGVEFSLIVSDIDKQMVKRLTLEPRSEIQELVRDTLSKYMTEEEITNLICTEKLSIEQDFNKDWKKFTLEKSVLDQSKIELKGEQAIFSRFQEKYAHKEKECKKLKEYVDSIDKERECIKVKIARQEKQLENMMAGFCEGEDREIETTLKSKIQELEDELEKLNIMEFRFDTSKRGLLEMTNELEGKKQKYEKKQREIEKMENDLNEMFEEIELTRTRLTSDFEIAFDIQVQLKNEKNQQNLLPQHPRVPKSSLYDDDDEKYDKEVPDRFLCPLSKCVMSIPVLLVEAGQIYEEEYIKGWLKENDVDPLTRKQLKSKQLVCVYVFKSQIEEWKMKHRVK